MIIKRSLRNETLGQVWAARDVTIENVQRRAALFEFSSLTSNIERVLESVLESVIWKVQVVGFFLFYCKQIVSNGKFVF